MKAFNNFLNILIGATIGCFVGSTAFRYWQLHTHPEFYAMQSAPWYVGVWVQGILAAGVILIALIIKLIIRKHIK
ncbi:MAG: hypothetical protein IJO80_01635 [Firmicutes bacterium]|nr:hypothetical protein [Bacillota bacterium]MBQ6841902.1 hypothetical protein [Bacillota bacterium]